MTLRTERRLWILLPLVIGLLGPIVALVSIDPSLQVVTTARGLFITFIVVSTGIFPFAALSAACIWVGHLLPPRRVRYVALAGVTGILVVFVPGYIQIFTSTSSTVIVGVFILAFECFISLIAGLLVGWAVSFFIPFGHGRNAEPNEADGRKGSN
jgi:hypothetical protein